MESNPYQTPNQPPPSGNPYPAASLRPASITVFGVLNLLFGALGICGNAAGAIIFFVPLPNNGQNPVMDLMAHSPAYRMMNMTMLVLGFIGAVALIISGIGLLQSKRYGRSLAVLYSFYSLAILILGMVVNTFFVFMPLLAKLDELPPGPQKAGAIGGIVGGLVGGCFGFLYPSLLLFFMTRKNVVDALQK